MSFFFFFSSRRRHTRFDCDWSSDVCSSDLALRVDKLTIASLEVTLGAYLRAAWDEIPTIRMIRATPQVLKRRAENFIRELRPELPLDEVEIEVAEGASLAGGGSTPSQSLPTKIIRIASVRYSATKLEQRLRRAP